MQRANKSDVTVQSRLMIPNKEREQIQRQRQRQRFVSFLVPCVGTRSQSSCHVFVSKRNKTRLDSTHKAKMQEKYEYQFVNKLRPFPSIRFLFDVLADLWSVLPSGSDGRTYSYWQNAAQGVSICQYFKNTSTDTNTSVERYKYKSNTILHTTDRNINIQASIQYPSVAFDWFQ